MNYKTYIYVLFCLPLMYDNQILGAELCPAKRYVEVLIPVLGSVTLLGREVFADVIKI